MRASRFARFGGSIFAAVTLATLSGDGVARTAASESNGPAALEAHVDPTTGRLVSEPVTPRASALPVAPADVLESSAPGGGIMSVVPRQYFSHMVATLAADGSVQMDCVVPAQQRR